jgi:hypothetical protein
MRRSESLRLENAAKVMVDASYQLDRETRDRILSVGVGI